jgi:hypothetical protein
MSNIVPHSASQIMMPSSLLSREHRAIARETNRELIRAQGQAMVRALQTDVEARLADMKIGAAVGLGTSAQQHVATMTAMEGELMKAVPLAASRLEMIGNLTAIATTEIVTDAVAKFRRI